MTVHIANEQAMVRFAMSFSQTLQAGDCLALSGELGAGKSFLARAMMRALGVQDEAMPSPTFSIIQEYQVSADLHIAHMDWYRLEGPQEVASLGIEEFFLVPWISIIEWSSRASHLLPPHTQHINIALDPQYQDKRILHLPANSMEQHP